MNFLMPEISMLMLLLNSGTIFDIRKIEMVTSYGTDDWFKFFTNTGRTYFESVN